METEIEVVQFANPLIREFKTATQISTAVGTVGVTSQNLPFVLYDTNNIGELACEIVRNILEFNIVQIIYIQSNTLSVSLYLNKNSSGKVCDWEFLSDQIVSIIEKAIEEQD